MAQSHLNCRNTTVRITLISWVLLPASNLSCWERRWEECRRTSPWSPGSQTDLNLYWKLLSILALPAKEHWSTTGKCALLHFLQSVPTLVQVMEASRGIKDEQKQEYRDLISHFRKWCRKKLPVNVDKTTRWCGPQTGTIMSQDAELVNTYRYCGVHLGYKLEFAADAG